MELKTKYNIGEGVYYIAYATVERECECCGQTIDDEVPDSVKKGKIIGISVNAVAEQDLGNIISETTYKINTEGNWFVLRNSNFVYNTEEEAQAAFEKENEQIKAENAALRERLEKAVVFPIKFGDKIYTINFQKPKAQWSVHCGVVKTISVTQTPDKTQFVFRVKIKYRDAREYVLGKSAFLSKEAAEVRLAELKGGENEQRNVKI